MHDIIMQLLASLGSFGALASVFIGYKEFKSRSSHQERSEAYKELSEDNKMLRSDMEMYRKRWHEAMRQIAGLKSEIEKLRKELKNDN